MSHYSIHAHWDDEAHVWWAESDDILGLVAEAPTYEALKEDLARIVPELMGMNAQAYEGKLQLLIVTDEVLSIA